MTTLSTLPLDHNLLCKLSYYAAGSAMPAHQHELAQFSFLLCGQVHESTLCDEYAIYQPSLCFKPATLVHENQYGQQGALILSFNFATNMLTDLAALTPPNYLWQPLQRISPKQLKALLTAQLAQDTQQATDCFWDLLSQVSSLPAYTELTPPSWLKQAQQRLEEYDDSVALSDIAMQIGVHPVHFSRTFKRFFHCSASEYRQRKQLDRAILQLSQQHSLSDTALQAGFADQSHMQRSFRRYLGTTPRQLQMLVRLKQL